MRSLAQALEPNRCCGALKAVNLSEKAVHQLPSQPSLVILFAQLIYIHEDLLNKIFGFRYELVLSLIHEGILNRNW